MRKSGLLIATMLCGVFLLTGKAIGDHEECPRLSPRPLDPTEYIERFAVESKNGPHPLNRIFKWVQPIRIATNGSEGQDVSEALEKMVWEIDSAASLSISLSRSSKGNIPIIFSKDILQEMTVNHAGLVEFFTGIPAAEDPDFAEELRENDACFSARKSLPFAIAAAAIFVSNSQSADDQINCIARSLLSSIGIHNVDECAVKQYFFDDDYVLKEGARALIRSFYDEKLEPGDGLSEAREILSLDGL